MNTNENQIADQVPENSPSVTTPIKQNSPDEEKIAIGRALADLRIYAISFHINPNGNYYHCNICNSESKESNITIEHSEGCSIASCLATLRKSKAGQEEEEREQWRVAEDDAGCVMGRNNNVIGLAQNADNADNFVKEHNK